MRLILHIADKTRNDVHGNPSPAFEYTIYDEAESNSDDVQKFVGIETSFDRAEKDGIFRLLRHSATSAQGDKAVQRYYDIKTAERKLCNLGATVLHDTRNLWHHDRRLKNYHKFIMGMVEYYKQFHGIDL
jgi:hypothetical protein